jgi:hypothetical protein
MVTVPDVVGLAVADARARVEAAGLVLAFLDEEDGVVATQDPPANTRLPRGRIVTVSLEVAAEEDDGLSSTVVLVLVGLAAAAAGLVGGRFLRARRRGRGWVSDHVAVVPTPGPPSYDVSTAGTSHDVGLVPQQQPPRVDLEEVLDR